MIKSIPQLKGILHNTVACVEHYPTGKDLHNIPTLQSQDQSQEQKEEKGLTCFIQMYSANDFIYLSIFIQNT